MTTEEKEQFYMDLVQLIRQLERTYKRVFPYMLVPHLEIYRCEQTLRKDLSYLAGRGALVRIGGPRARRGYSADRNRTRWLPITPPVSGPPPLRRAA